MGLGGAADDRLRRVANAGGAAPVAMDRAATLRRRLLGVFVRRHRARHRALAPADAARRSRRRLTAAPRRHDDVHPRQYPACRAGAGHAVVAGTGPPVAAGFTRACRREILKDRRDAANCRPQNIVFVTHWEVRALEGCTSFLGILPTKFADNL